VCLTGTPFGAWAKAAWPALSDAVLDHYAAVRVRDDDTPPP
jgi:hypothetical protein